MTEDEEPTDVISSPQESKQIQDQIEQQNTFPLKNVFDTMLDRAREIRKKYSGDDNVEKKE